MSVNLNSPNVVIGHMSGGTININNHAAATPTNKERPIYEDIEPVPTQEVKDYFRYITPKCISEKRAEAVEAEISAACKGTAEGLWRTLWNNENLGFVVVQPIDATTLYRDIEKHFGKLPYSDRQFRAARNKR